MLQDGGDPLAYGPRYRMTEEQNIFLAKRNIVDYIWKSVRLEGLSVTFSQTQDIYDGGIINGLFRDEVVAVNNLKHAWQFLFETINYPLDLAYLCHINQVVGANLICDSGSLRKSLARMGGTSWVPDMPIESMMKEELAEIMKITAPTDRAITLMLWSMLAANQIMIQNGCGVISVPIEQQDTFRKLLVQFYETNEMSALKRFVYDRCVDGVDFPSPEPEQVNRGKGNRRSELDR